VGRATGFYNQERNTVVSDNSTDYEVISVEVEYIRKFKANNPSIGYNRWPKHEDK